MHIFLKRQIFGGGESHTRCGNTLDRGVGREVHEHYRSVDCARTFEVGDEIISFFKCDAHGGKHNGETAFAVQNLCLTCNLRRKLGVRETGAGEDWQFLTSYQCVHTVDGRNARLDKFGRIVAGSGVDRRTVDILALFGNYGCFAVNGVAHARKDTAENILTECKLYSSARKADGGICKVKPCGGIEKLKQCLVTVKLKHLAAALFAVFKGNRAEFVIFYAADLVHQHKRTCDFAYSLIFLDHF